MQSSAFSWAQRVCIAMVVVIVVLIQHGPSKRGVIGWMSVFLVGSCNECSLRDEEGKMF